MPRKSEVTTANLVDHLSELHGPEVDVVQVRNAADHFGVSYATACKRIDSYKSSSCLLYTSPSPRDLSTSRMPSSA